MSLHRDLMNDAAGPGLVEVLGDEDADAGVVLYWPPRATEGVKWPAAIVGRLTTAGEETLVGTHQTKEHREQTTITAPRPATPVMRNGHFEIPRYPGEKFAVERISEGSANVKVWVFRDAREAMQRRGTERG